MTKKVDVVSNMTEKLGKNLANFYDKALLKSLEDQPFFRPKIIGYRKVRVPVYFEIKIPVLEPHYDTDYEFGTGEFEGYLLTTKVINRIKIGTRIEEQPIYKKEPKKGKTITFERYQPL